jgi:hypothetical protein
LDNYAPHNDARRAAAILPDRDHVLVALEAPNIVGNRDEAVVATEVANIAPVVALTTANRFEIQHTLSDTTSVGVIGVQSFPISTLIDNSPDVNCPDRL